MAEPGRGWYLLAGSVALSSVAAIAAVIVWLVYATIQEEQFLAPGRHTVELVAPGNYLLWNDYRTSFGGRSYDDTPELPAGMRISVIDKASGRTVQTHPKPGSNLSIGNTERHSVARFTIMRPGHYEIIVEGDFPARVLSESRDFMNDMFWGVAGIFTLSLLGFGIAMAIFGWAYFKREQAATSAARAHAPPPAAGAQTFRDEAALKRLTALVYGLQIASFFVGLTFIAGVIINYIKRKDVEGTWLESHFRWQIRTFWFGLLWSCIGLALLIVLVGALILVGTAVWVLYRAIKGWIELSEGKPLYF